MVVLVVDIGVGCVFLVKKQLLDVSFLGFCEVVRLALVIFTFAVFFVFYFVSFWFFLSALWAMVIDSASASRLFALSEAGLSAMGGAKDELNPKLTLADRAYFAADLNRGIYI